jgi:hypothetical protein
MNIEDIKKYMTETSVTDIEKAFKKVLTDNCIAVIKNAFSKAAESTNPNSISNDEIRALNKDIRTHFSNHIFYQSLEGMTIHFMVTKKVMKSNLIKTIKSKYNVIDNIDDISDDELSNTVLIVEDYYNYLSGKNILSPKDKVLINCLSKVKKGMKVTSFVGCSFDVNDKDMSFEFDEPKLISMLNSSNLDIFNLGWSILWNSTYIPKLITTNKSINFEPMTEEQKDSFCRTIRIIQGFKTSNIRDRIRAFNLDNKYTTDSYKYTMCIVILLLLQQNSSSRLIKSGLTISPNIDEDILSTALDCNLVEKLSWAIQHEYGA